MRFEDSRLLMALHEGVFDQTPWRGFLDGLRVRTGTALTALLIRPAGEMPPIEFAAGGPVPPQLASLAHDSAPYRLLRAGRVYGLDELFDPAKPEHHDLREDLTGASDGRVMRVAEPGGIEAWLCCIGDDHLGWAALSALMAELAPHIAVALRAFAASERERFRAAVDADAFRRLDMGWLTLDAQCRIVDATPYVERLFAQARVLRRGPHDRLAPASAAIDRDLAGLVRRCAADPATRSTALSLSDDPPIDMLVCPAGARASSPLLPVVAIAYVGGAGAFRTDRCDQLVDLFGLLPSEARLASAITRGLSIAEAADELGLTLETARNYSKKIYHKAGARGQPDLVRRTLASVLTLA